MKRIFTLFFIVVFSMACKSQDDCSFVKDTLTLPKDKKTVEGDYLQTTLKNLSVVTLFKSSDNKYYLKLVITEDFYFDKVDMLEIKSGSKSIHIKDVQQYKINKTRGLYVIEIFRNYLATLKEDGITSIVFNNAETDFTRQDASQVKKIAKCLYETAVVKK